MVPQLKTMLRAALLGASDNRAPRAAAVPGSLDRPEGRRHYLLAQPARAAAAQRPLVIVLHGAGASAKQVLGMAFPPSPLSVWREIAAREQLVVIAPDAGKGGWNDCCADAARVARKDDVAFIAALIDDAVARHGVDPDRVHLIGVSRGGLMAYRAAVEIPHKLAAFSAVLACMPLPGRAAPPVKPLPALIFAGTADPFMPYEGGKFFHTLGFLDPLSSIADSVRTWRELAGLPDTPQVTDIAPGKYPNKTRATRFMWGGSAEGMQVGLVRIENGGHAEPSALQRYPEFLNRLVGPQNGDLEVAEAAWEFFREKRISRRVAADAPA
ncbi:MAG: alpha/beta fold hydrolase [Telluria sp.]